MVDAKERFIQRFQLEFEGKDLANVKFFVRSNRMSVASLIDEINKFEDTVGVGHVRAVDVKKIDADQVSFDAPFV
jgi:hypothetical protein